MLGFVSYKNFSPPLVTENIPEEVIVNPFIHNYKGYKGIVVHLLNCLGTKFDTYAVTPDDSTYEFLDYPSPRNFIPKDKSMSIKVKAKDIKNVYLISPDFTEVVKLRFNRGKDGYYCIEVPDLGRYEIIYIVQGKKDLVKDVLLSTTEEFPTIQPFPTQTTLVETEKVKTKERKPDLIEADDFSVTKSTVQIYKNYNWNIKDTIAKDGVCVFGKGSNLFEMKGSFNLEVIPNSLSLEICALNDNSEKKCLIEILINGNSIFKGSNEFASDEWLTKTYTVDTKLLKKGENIVTIRNLEDSTKVDSPPWFMVNQIKIIKK